MYIKQAALPLYVSVLQHPALPLEVSTVGYSSNIVNELLFLVSTLEANLWMVDRCSMHESSFCKCSVRPCKSSKRESAVFIRSSVKRFKWSLFRSSLLSSFLAFLSVNVAIGFDRCDSTSVRPLALTSLSDDVLFTLRSHGILDSLFQNSSFRLCSLCALSALLSLHVFSGLDELNQFDEGYSNFDSAVCVCVLVTDLALDNFQIR
jgi:hypothetical protein